MNAAEKIVHAVTVAIAKHPLAQQEAASNLLSEKLMHRFNARAFGQYADVNNDCSERTDYERIWQYVVGTLSDMPEFAYAATVFAAAEGLKEPYDPVNHALSPRTLWPPRFSRSYEDICKYGSHAKAHEVREQQIFSGMVSFQIKDGDDDSGYATPSPPAETVPHRGPPCFDVQPANNE
jgi:hypothetical protein